MSSLLLLHIVSAVVGLLSGFLAMVFRKGSGFHGAAGNVFFVSMLGMSASGVSLAAIFKPNGGNVMGGALTFYLVATGWAAARRRGGKAGPFDGGALLLAFAIAAAGATWGFQAAASPAGQKFGYAPGIYFVFGAIAALFAVSDVRMLVRGGMFGAKRIARHLLRMCLALLIATLSFYPGQARLFSKSLRATNFLYLPHVLLVGAMVFWLVRVAVRKRLHKPITETTHGESFSARAVGATGAV